MLAILEQKFSMMAGPLLPVTRVCLHNLNIQSGLQKQVLRFSQNLHAKCINLHILVDLLKRKLNTTLSSKHKDLAAR